MAQLVEALCFKPEGRGFDSEYCHLNFSLTLSFRPHYGLGVTQPLPETGSVQSFNGVALPFYLLQLRATILLDLLRKEMLISLTIS